MNRTLVTILTAFLLVGGTGCADGASKRSHSKLKPSMSASADSVVTGEKRGSTEVIRLSEEDYVEVAKRLGIEVATIKAVVEIEAGATHQGFFKAGQPLINFDMSMFRKFARTKGINLAKYNKSHAVVFSRPNVKRYGSTQAGQQERLRMARTIDAATAIQGCFWGMFQIGGFNWKRCGCESIEEFVERMSVSEREQLELFANFVTNSGMLPHLKNRNWSAFARMYNGPSYASRGYHTRLANSYRKHGGKK
ncbi:MAG: N-acetylmuramidase family protein [Firmicutes bacterium]|nr:N-acetylmuramidase family protein [Bacillota bacterium]MCM1401923.1 N-acetylmuramidase family protein [Bacteroides sp.]MCM1476655.1 N-acetylmuramidase family protein [Bacteroides sp.]